MEDIWTLENAKEGSKEEQNLLDRGYEPFGASMDKGGDTIIFFKKKVRVMGIGDYLLWGL